MQHLSNHVANTLIEGLPENGYLILHAGGKLWIKQYKKGFIEVCMNDGNYTLSRSITGIHFVFNKKLFKGELYLVEEGMFHSAVVLALSKIIN
jgi:hypothetical protein